MTFATLCLLLLPKHHDLWLPPFSCKLHHFGSSLWPLKTIPCTVHICKNSGEGCLSWRPGCLLLIWLTFLQVYIQVYTPASIVKTR